MRYFLPAAALAVTLLLGACSGEPAPAPAPSQPAAPAETAPVAANDDALAPLFGSWALDPASCGEVLRISKTRFEGAENGCDISGYTDNGDGSFTAAMACTSAGQTANELIRMRPIFAPTGEGIDLTYIDRDGLEVTVLRCAAPTQD
jgi:hypothetical protein